MMFENQQLYEQFNEIFFSYEHVGSTTWLYLTTLLSIAVFFKFGRLFSMRNLDIILLTLFSPCFMLVSYGEMNGFPETERLGYVTLWVMGGIFILRMFYDCTMIRRPLLEPNLSAGGLSFLVFSLFVLLVSNVSVGYIQNETEVPRDAKSLSMPGYRILEDLPPVPVAFWESPFELHQQAGEPGVYPFEMSQALSLGLVIAAQFFVVMGLILVGFIHFENVRMGLGAAVFYLLIPYTGEMGGHIDHVLPGALLVWAILFYRKPFIAGVLLSLSFCIYYPLFLIPLWVSFYWQRGVVKFGTGVALGWALLVLGLVLTQREDVGDLINQLKRMHGFLMPQMDPRAFQGLWEFGWTPVYRIPLITAFIMMSITYAMWPAQKNLGSLISCTAALLLATRFWNGEGGGLYLGWSLPLIVLIMFRPNLEDRVMLSRETGNST
tara:strand:+ start:4571 stop:5878 length:1308 start_codon:yes stop_codon:yes gene_type:complete